MKLLRSAVMAFSMFTRLPMPKVEWRKENMQYMLACLPLTGAVLGLFLYLWRLLAAALSFSGLLFGLGIASIPVLYTGGIHLDGFMDTVDALSCRGTPEKKHQVMKDSRTGAFAVLYMSLYLIGVTVLGAELGTGCRAFLFLIPAVSRIGSAFAGLTFPVYGEEGLLKTFRVSSDAKPALVLTGIFALIAFLAGVFDSFFGILALFLTEAFCLVFIRRMSRRQFGGMSGDISGFLLTVSEIAMLFVSVILGKAGLL